MYTNVNSNNHLFSKLGLTLKNISPIGTESVLKELVAFHGVSFWRPGLSWPNGGEFFMVIFIRRKSHLSSTSPSRSGGFWTHRFPTNQPCATGPLNLDGWWRIPCWMVCSIFWAQVMPNFTNQKRTKAIHLGLCKIIGGIFKVGKLGDTFCSWVKTSPKTNGWMSTQNTVLWKFESRTTPPF